ncbi:hypothetical protein C8F01DRAFT_216920 [Mycena amicta]|nr:hypothetical protein C8F01DRAFT_216920 [Mycena amicta]
MASTLDGTIGAGLLGFVFSTFLLGILTIQVFNYYRNFPKDRLSLRITVGAVWILDLGHTICGWSGLYAIVVTFYGQPQHILNPPPAIAYIPVFSCLVSLLVQSFFSIRIGHLTKNWIAARMLLVFCAIPSVLTFIVVFILQSHGGTSFTSLQTGKGRIIMLVITTWLPCSHVLLAAVLCWHLWPFRGVNSTILFSTKRIVDKIIIWTIESTLLTCMVSLVYLIMYLTRKDLIWLAFYVVHPKLLSNTMMASLNSRHPKDLHNSATGGTLSLHIGGETSRGRMNTDISLHRITAEMPVDMGGDEGIRQKNKPEWDAV